MFVPPEKELQFFFDDRKYAKGLDAYLSHFEERARGQAFGEISPPYFHAYTARDARGGHLWTEHDPAARLKAAFPDAKILLTLRDPVKRMASQFWKNAWEGKESMPTLEEALEAERAGRRTPETSPFCWLYKARYGVHVDRWLEFFGRDRVLILIFEDWIRDPRGCVREIERFLDIAPWETPPESIPRTNAGRQATINLPPVFQSLVRTLPVRRGLQRRLTTTSGYPAMDPATRAQLHNLLSDDVAYVDALSDGRASRAWG